jgi:hypothetical protein
VSGILCEKRLQYAVRAAAIRQGADAFTDVLGAKVDDIIGAG